MIAVIAMIANYQSSSNCSFYIVLFKMVSSKMRSSLPVKYSELSYQHVISDTSMWACLLMWKHNIRNNSKINNALLKCYL